MKVNTGEANLSTRKCFLMMGLLGLGVISAGRCEGCIAEETLNLNENFGLNHKQKADVGSR